MTVTRRSFFRLLAGAALAPVAAKLALAMPAVPMLWGDGIHDDAAALNALIRGETVEFAEGLDAAGCGWVAPGYLRMPAGRFLTGAPLKFSDMDKVVVDCGEGVIIPAHDGAAIEVEESSRVIFNTTVVHQGDGPNACAVRVNLDGSGRMNITSRPVAKAETWDASGTPWVASE